MNITIGKQHEGKTIFGLGTGNNKSRSGPNDPVEFEVIKVNRKYVSLRVYKSVDNYDPESGATQQSINTGYGGNAGYLFFESLDDIEAYNEHRIKNRKVYGYFRSYGSLLSKEQTDKIHEILFDGEGDET